MYSALGAVKISLGLTLADLARRFDFRLADDPISSLRRDQANLIFTFSQLLEEGWATWIETFLTQEIFDLGTHPRHDIQAILNALESLPGESSERDEAQGALLGALMVLFSQEPVPLPLLHQAVMIIDLLGSDYDEYFGTAFGQPLRYAVGELLLAMAGINLGTGCVPYAVLIAANVTFDPSQVSLGDMRELLSNNPRLNPDTRLAALCRLQLQQPDSVSELARRAEDELSFSVPRQLKKQG